MLPRHSAIHTQVQNWFFRGDNPRNLPMTKPRQSAEAREAQLPGRFYSSSRLPATILHAAAK